MSIDVMSMVFKRYPRAGNERLLALAIADAADHDGTHVFPAVSTLAAMSAQSERSVQRLIHEMLAAGWLQLVRKSSGKRGETNEYRISPEWLAGGQPIPPLEVPDRRTVPKVVTGDKLAPVEVPGSVDKPVDELSTTGDTQGLSGDIAVSPNPSLPRIPIPPLPPVETGGCEQNPKQPEAGAHVPTSKERRRWRWANTRSGIEQRGEELRVQAWDKRLPSDGGEAFVAYAARVFASHLACAGVARSPSVVRQAIEAGGNWSEVLRQLAADQAVV